MAPSKEGYCPECGGYGRIHNRVQEVADGPIRDCKLGQIEASLAEANVHRFEALRFQRERNSAESERDALAAVVEAVRAVPREHIVPAGEDSHGVYVDGYLLDEALAQAADTKKVLAARDAKVLRDAADEMDLPGSAAAGYYATDSDSGYLQATRDAEKWFHDYAVQIEGGTL